MWCLINMFVFQTKRGDKDNLKWSWGRRVRPDSCFSPATRGFLYSFFPSFLQTNLLSIVYMSWAAGGWDGGQPHPPANHCMRCKIPSNPCELFVDIRFAVIRKLFPCWDFWLKPVCGAFLFGFLFVSIYEASKTHPRQAAPPYRILISECMHHLTFSMYIFLSLCPPPVLTFCSLSYFQSWIRSAHPPRIICSVNPFTFLCCFYVCEWVGPSPEDDVAEQMTLEILYHFTEM